MNGSGTGDTVPCLSRKNSRPRCRLPTHNWKVGTIRAAFWVAGAVLLAAVLVLTVHLSSNSLEFSRYNTGWNGTSAFFSDLDRHQVVMVTDPAQLAPYRNNTILLVIAPDRQPKVSEISAYRAFVERGNTLFLADDFGTGSSILSGLGSRITILEGNLSSVDREYADPYSVVVYRMANGSIPTRATRLVLNRPAALDGGDTLFMTSLLSWIDLNGDKRISAGDIMGQFPVMSEEQIGKGRLVVFSDPSIFINSMLEPDQPGDNLRFVRDLVTTNGTVLIDQMNSRTRDAEGISEILHVIRTTIPIELLFLALLVLAAVWAWRRRMV